MENLSFADKVNNAFEDGWKSNPQFSKALKEVEQVVEENRRVKEAEKLVTVEKVAVTREDDDEGR